MTLRQKRITNKDVARLAGVSTAVVSYVINNGPRSTSPEVRERVLKAVKTLGYHPSALARGLRRQRSHTVGFVVNDYFPLAVFISPYSAGLLTGLLDELKQHRYFLLVYPIEMGEELSSFELLLRSGRLDGVVVRLIQDSPASDRLLRIISAAKLPCVCLERSVAPHFPFPSVTSADAIGGEQAMQYLISQGHRRIGYIHGDLRYASAQTRLESYKRVLSANNLPLDEQLIRGHSWTSADAAAAMRDLLNLDKPPTAVFAASDELARSAINVLREQGLRVPHDMAVVGFDDMPLASEMTPALTTVRIPMLEMGRAAADLLIQQIDQPDISGESVVLKTELIPRGTA
jgi:LacI family transcriptional regulator